MGDRDLTPFLDTRQNQLQLEMSAADAIDTKALGVLASDFAVLLFIGQSSTINLHSYLVIAILVLLIVALVITGAVIWPTEYAGASTSARKHPEYLRFTTNKLVKQLIADTEAAIQKNKVINEWRWRWCARAIILTLIALVALFVVLYFKLG